MSTEVTIQEIGCKDKHFEDVERGEYFQFLPPGELLVKTQSRCGRINGAVNLKTGDFVDCSDFSLTVRTYSRINIEVD